MSFASYLLNMAFDAVLIILGLGLALASIQAFVKNQPLLALVMLAIAGVSLLYSRYRASRKNITY